MIPLEEYMGLFLSIGIVGLFYITSRYTDSQIEKHINSKELDNE